MLRPTIGSGLIISWAGMRGIVSLAAAMALPAAFPYRDLIVLTAFCVVLGTLAIQGLTLKPLLRALDLHDDDPVGRELTAARERALRAGLASLASDQSPAAAVVRQELLALPAPLGPPVEAAEAEVAVGHERAHLALGGQRHRGAVVRRGRRRVRTGLMRDDLAQEAARPCLVPALTALASERHGALG